LHNRDRWSPWRLSMGSFTQEMNWIHSDTMKANRLAKRRGDVLRRSLVLCAVIGLAIATADRFAVAETVYITLEKDNALAVVDGDTGKLVTTAKVGKRPRGIVLSRDGKQLYVAASDDDAILVIDATSLRKVGTLPSGDDPETFAMDPDGKFLYVSNEDDNLVTVIDLVKRSKIKSIPVGVEPEGIAVSPDGRWVASTSETTNMVHWIDRARLEVVDNTLVDPRPRAAAFTADSRQLWVTSEIAGVLSVLDVESRQPVKRISFSIPGVTSEKIQPVGIRIDPQRRYGYVALGPANRVAVIDAQKLEVVTYLLVGQRVWNLEFSPDFKRLYTTNGVSNDVSLINLEDHRVTRSIAVGNFPWGVVVRP
jgi:PQQ-dependent catabolism-associated beta-propeller protein